MKQSILKEQEYGEITAPPLILLHGFGGSSAWWEPVIQPLARSYHIYLLDIRYDQPLNHLTAALLSWIQRKQLKQCFLAGHSLGARLCLQLAAQCPQVSRLILTNPAVPLPEVAWWSWIWKCHQARQVSSHPPQEGSFFQQLKHLQPGAWKWALQALRCTLHVQVQIPTLILCGKSDPLFPPHCLWRLEAEVEQATTLLVEAGHSIMCEYPDVFCKEVLRFLSGETAVPSFFPLRKYAHCQWRGLA